MSRHATLTTLAQWQNPAHQPDFTHPQCLKPQSDFQSRTTGVPLPRSKRQIIADHPPTSLPSRILTDRDSGYTEPHNPT